MLNEIYLKLKLRPCQHCLVAQSGPIFENSCQRYPLAGRYCSQVLATTSVTPLSLGLKTNDSSTFQGRVLIVFVSGKVWNESRPPERILPFPSSQEEIMPIILFNSLHFMLLEKLKTPEPRQLKGRVHYILLGKNRDCFQTFWTLSRLLPKRI